MSKIEERDREILRIHSDFCKVFSNSKRLEILFFLSEGERSVGDIATELGISVANASQHLRIMRDQGALKVRKQGQQAFYRIANENFVEGAKFIGRGLREEHRLRDNLMKNRSYKAVS